MDALGKKLFKTSVVGGFNREDVYAYIESLINQHNAEVAGLRNELKGATAKNVEAAEKIGDLSAQLTELENKRKELAAAAENRQALAQKAEELEARNQELGVGLREKEQVLTQLHGELAKLRHRIAGYENLEEEYTSNKSRLAELELSALARASELENQAQARGRELEEQARQRYEENERQIEENRRSAQLEVERILSDITSAYIRLQAEMDAFSARFDDLLADTKNNVDALTRTTGGAADCFAALEQKCRSFCGAPEEKESAGDGCVHPVDCQVVE